MDPFAHKYPSLSPYAYVANNPIIFIDPDGRKIVIHYVDNNGNAQTYTYRPGVTKGVPANTYVSNSVAAINHLRNSDSKVQNYIDQLSNNPRLVTDLRDTKGAPHTQANSSRQADVNWNSTTGVKLVDDAGNETGKKQSPATILGHELKHVFNLFSNPNQFATDAGTNTGNHYENVEDSNVIQGAETDIVNGSCDSQEGTRTNHYSGDFYQTTGPTTTEEAPVDNSYNNQKTLDVQQRQNQYTW